MLSLRVDLDISREWFHEVFAAPVKPAGVYDMAYSSLQIVILLTAATSVGGLLCYESACLHGDLARCPTDGRAVLKKCDVAAFISIVRAIKAPTLAKSIQFKMVCAKLGWEGYDDSRAVVLRMCHPDVSGLCEKLQNYTIEMYYRQPLHPGRLPLVHRGCYFCDVDGCNTATPGAARPTLVAVLLAACATCLLLTSSDNR